MIKPAPVHLWESYTPSWNASTGTPSLGNGTTSGQFIKIGRTIIVMAAVTAGSTTTFGAGTYSMTLPPGFPVSPFSSRLYGLLGVSTDASVPASVPLWGFPFSTTEMSGIDAAGAQVTPTVPVTWAQNDIIRFQAVYQY